MIYLYNIVVSIRKAFDVADDAKITGLSPAFVVDISTRLNEQLNLVLENINVMAAVEWLHRVRKLGLVKGDVSVQHTNTPDHIVDMFQYKFQHHTPPCSIDDTDVLLAFLSLMRGGVQHCVQGKDYLEELQAAQDEIHARGKAITELDAALRKAVDERDNLKAANDKLRGELYTLLQQPAAKSLRIKHDGCPAHYDLGEVGEVLDVCRELARTLPESFSGAYIGGMYLELVKYVLRAPRKNGVDDLLKAAHYINIITKELRQ